MKKFTEIESFRHVIQKVKRYCAEKHKPFPVIDYVGTVKLHGTNAGVRVTHNKVQAQSRNHIIDVGNDNAGFAAFVKQNEEVFQRLANAELNGVFSSGVLKEGQDITFFGEWCGEGIMKGVGINALPKHYVIFAAWVNDEYVSLKSPSTNIPEKNIYYINHVDPWEITIDFSKPEDYIDQLTRYTLDVENECPWAASFGEKGVGEGIVWQPKEGSPYFGNSDFWFKTKGLKHKGADKTKPKTVEIDAAKVNSIRELVATVLPEWRLEQGFAALKEQNIPLTPQATGPYIKWVCQDVLKEESDVLEKNGLNWKEVSRYVTDAARQYYLTELDKKVLAKD